jgi:hypothetical protein
VPGTQSAGASGWYRHWTKIGSTIFTADAPKTTGNATDLKAAMSGM